MINKTILFVQTDLEVMRALRNISTLYKVAIHGPFTNEFFKTISTLVHNDPNIGDPFLPMRGVIVDRCPTSEDQFEIIILFERMSLMK